MLIDATEFASHPIDVIGALDYDKRPQGISPRRLPAWTRPQIPQMLDVMARMPSGVRLRFNTDATTIRLTCLVTQMVRPGREEAPVAFNLELPDGELLTCQTTDGNKIRVDPDDPTRYDLERGIPSLISFKGLPEGSKDVQLWLPHGSYVELRQLALEGTGSRPLERATQQQPLWVHYGSSISHCMEAEQPALTWPAVAARLGAVDLVSLGFGGQCHADPFIARTMTSLAPDFISAKIGINIINADSMRERVFVPTVHGFLDTLRERCPKTPILLVSPIFCPSTEDAPGPTVPDEHGRFVALDRPSALATGALTLRRVRVLLEEIVNSRQDPGLGYLSGLDLFGEEDAVDLPDDLHPNPAGYIRMGGRFAARVFSEEGIWHSHR